MSEGITKEEIIEQWKGNKILKVATFVVGIAVVAFLGYLIYQKFIVEPNNQKSQEDLGLGLMYLEQDSLALAKAEFEYMVGEYDGNSGGEIAQYGLASVLFEEGDYEGALKELEGVEIEDIYLSINTIGMMGDCYSEMGEYQKAVDKYIEAGDKYPNDATTPIFYMKAATCAEEVGSLDKALEFYKKIEADYPNYSRSNNIEKFIARAEGKK